MRNKPTTGLALLCAIFTTGAAALAAAQGPRHEGAHGPGFGPGRGHGAALERLGLTEEQRAQVQALRESERETMRPLHEAAREAHEAFEQSLEAKTPDVAEIGKAALGMRDARRNLEAARAASLEKVKALLTPEQREQLEQLEERGFGRSGHGPRAAAPLSRNH